MPRGQKRSTAPKWARQDNDRIVLHMLAEHPDGLRLEELYGLVKMNMTKPTAIAALRRLMSAKLVDYTTLKRYQINRRGFQDLRTRAVKRIMEESNFVYQPPLADESLNKALTASLFIYTKPPRTSPRNIGVGYLAAEKKRQLFLDSWLYYLARYAISRGLAKSKTALDEVKPDDLVRSWEELFPHPQEIVVVEYLNSDALLNWLQRPHARETIAKALREFPNSVLNVG